MRYRIPDPFDREDTPADMGPSGASTPPPPTAQDDTTTARPSADAEPASGSASEKDPAPEREPAPDGGAEPPLWSTADDHVLHLPPQAVERILVAVPQLWPR